MVSGIAGFEQAIPRVERFRLVQVEPLEDVVGKIDRGGGAGSYQNAGGGGRCVLLPARANPAVAPQIAATGTLSFRNVCAMSATSAF